MGTSMGRVMFMGQVEGLVAPVYRGFWEQGEFPGATVELAQCRHRVWVLPEVLPHAAGRMLICVDCAVAMMRRRNVESKILPGTLDRFCEESPELVGELRAFMAKYGIEER